MVISAQCNRVPVSDGHLISVSVRFDSPPTKEEMILAFSQFKALPQELNLPSAPKQPIHYFTDDFFPQTKLHRDLESGMAVSVGRLQSCNNFHFKFVVLVHNTIRGAAGCAILNAELLTKKGFIFW